MGRGQIGRDAGEGRPAEILTIGLEDAERGSVARRVLGALAEGVVSLPADEATPDRLRGALLVLSPVMGRSLDAVELATKLKDSGFRGRWLAFAEELPDRNIVMREVGEVAPEVAFDLVVLGGGPRLAR